jgi:hypothetical protein
MRTILWSFPVLLLALLAACSSCCGKCSTECPAQATVEAVAREHPDCVRLTVHCTPPGASSPIACASTAADKKGKPSDPEDLQAMQTGQPVVLEEAGALDVTVPILAKDGKFLATCGVTLKTGGASREQLVAKATAIAKTVEGRLPACCSGGACGAKGSCCGSDGAKEGSCCSGEASGGGKDDSCCSK